VNITRKASAAATQKRSFHPNESEEAMPAKQTRESIEAELKASEIDRIKIQFLEILREIEEVETELRELEGVLGLPASQREKKLPDRMAAMGMSRAGIDKVQKYLDALEMLNAGGGVDRLRADVKQAMAARADAELTGAELLAGIVQSHRKA
jgi:hypothetical protein